VAIAVLQGGWLVFDGARALIVGDYVTPAAGSRAGQLGPWSRLVAALGLEPRGAFMKCVHVALGAAWLGSAAWFVAGPATGWWAVLACAVATLWYLPIGTVLGAIEIALLLAISR
jgi:hypothetical protein